VTLDGFLTVLGLAAAVYAVVPAVPRLRAGLALVIQGPVAVLAVTLALYFEFFSLLSRPCALPWSSVCAAITLQPQGLQPTQIAFLVVLIWLPLAWIIHKLARPGPGTLPAIGRLVDEMIYEQRFAELITFIEPYLPFIAAAAGRDLPLQRLSDQCARWRRGPSTRAEWPKPPFLDALEPETAPQPLGWRRFLPLVGHLGAWLPSQARAEDAASDIVRALLNDPGLRKFTVEMRPYFGLPLMKLSAGRPDDFAEQFLTDLIAHRGSALYRELEQNQNLSGLRRYHIPERNRLLTFLLTDARMAERLSAYRPIGEHTLKMLRPGQDITYLQRLNHKPERFDDECWQDPVWAALFFFDIMIKEAAFQDIAWHMWLYYVPLIVDGLVANHDETGEGVDPSDEHPTIGTFLIYRAFDMVGSWVALIEDLPATSVHRLVPTGRDQNGNIPQSAAIALGRCLATVLLSDRVGGSFKTYLMTVVARDVKGLPKASPIREALIRSIFSGGIDFSKTSYAPRLRTAFGAIDFLLRSDVEDLAAAIAAAKDRPRAGRHTT